MRACRRVLPVFAALAGAAPLLAHGGQYRGPGNVVPPTVGTGSSNNSGTSTSGSANAPSSGATGSSAGSVAPASGSSNAGAGRAGAAGSGGTARGVVLDDDLGRWEFWWEFGKDPFLRLRDAIYAASRTPEDDLLTRGRLGVARGAVQRPSQADLDRVAEALVARLRQTTNRDTVSGCVVALAKLGRESPDWNLDDLFTPYLRVGDQELRETAALALGIAGRLEERPIEILVGLVLDNGQGRKLSGDVPVNERTRAFAAYGLGLLLARTKDPAVAQRLGEPLLTVLQAPRDHGRELKVAAVEALAQLPRALGAAAGKLLRARVLAALGSYYTSELGPGERLLQAHVPPAIARILPPGDSAVPYWRDLFAADLRSGIESQDAGAQQTRGGNLFVAQSCVLALGGLCRPFDQAGDDDEAAALLLLDCYARHRDHQTRAFSLLSLARIGGAKVREALLKELDRASRAIEQPWCAMALGVFHSREVEMAAARGLTPTPDALLAEKLTEAFDGARNPSSIGALAVALGLAGDLAAGDRLRKALAANEHRDDVAGYVALALGLLRDPLAVNDVRTLLPAAARRPFLLMQCVRALGLIGDYTVSDVLCQQLETGDQSLVRLSAAASALGQIGDRRSIDPLLRMLANDKLSDLTRAFAAVALGTLCDKDPLPWNTAFATHTNYRAATETLTNGQSGILDIL